MPPPTNADPRTEDDPPPANWPATVERLVERWGWVHTIALLAVVLVFSWVWRLSHGLIDLWQYRQQRAADAEAGIELQDAQPARPPGARGPSGARGRRGLANPAGFSGPASNTRSRVRARDRAAAAAAAALAAQT